MEQFAEKYGAKTSSISNFYCVIEKHYNEFIYDMAEDTLINYINYNLENSTINSSSSGDCTLYQFNKKGDVVDSDPGFYLYVINLSNFIFTDYYISL